VAAVLLLSTVGFGVSASDPAGFAAVPIALVGASLAACVVPGFRASRAAAR
jgi:hypothetical protein